MTFQDSSSHGYPHDRQWAFLESTLNMPEKREDRCTTLLQIGQAAVTTAPRLRRDEEILRPPSQRFV